jgi:hypothetical protein
MLKIILSSKRKKCKINFMLLRGLFYIFSVKEKKKKKIIKIKKLS